MKFECLNKETPCRILKPTILSVWVLCSWLSLPLRAEPVELLPAGDFEDPKTVNAHPGWEVVNAGILKASDQARTGQNAVHFRAQSHPWGYCMFLHGPAHTDSGIKVQPGATYNLSIWARGRGRATLLVTEWSTVFLSSEFFEDTPAVTLTDEWQPIRVTYTPADPRIQRVAFAVRLLGDDAEVWLDDASFSFDPIANPGIELASRTQPTLPATLTLRSRDAADVRLTLNGRSVHSSSNDFPLVMREGFNVIELDARRAGDDPGLRLQLDGFPATASRWRIFSGETIPDQSHDPEFDDGHWDVADPARNDGWLWDSEDSDQIRLRQVILWNATHHRGPQRWVIPPMDEWGFSQSSMETFQVVLHALLPLSFNDSEFFIEMPASFRLMALDEHPERYVFNVPAETVQEETLERGGQAWRRYRIRYHARFLQPDYGHYALWPIVMEHPVPVGQTCSFRVYRHGRGNVTELPQKIPVRVLPPINGRQPERILIAAFNSLPWNLSYVSDAYMERLAAQSAATGFNLFTIGMNKWGDAWVAHTRRWHDLALANNISIALWPNNNYPFYGSWVAANRDDVAATYRWALDTPQARARYFDDTQTWTPEKENLSHLCPTYAVTHSDDFEACLREDYSLFKSRLPGATIIFQDFEQHAWNRSRGGSPSGEGSRCFCDLCKQAFAEYLEIPPEPLLSDRDIIDKYYTQWDRFWNRQHAKMLAASGRAGRALGMDYMLYSWASNRDLWKAAAGTLDILFAGMPGDAPADSYKQAGLDSLAQFYRQDVQAPLIMGQRFAFHHLRGPDRRYPASGNVRPLSHSGFFEPASWKREVLRVVTAFGGGIDLANSVDYRGGALYYIGEATRILAAFEPFFLEGQRRDETITTDDLIPANRLALEHNGERLILLFNETDTEKTVRITLQDVPNQARIRRFESDEIQPVTEAMVWKIAPYDVTVLHVIRP